MPTIATKRTSGKTRKQLSCCRKLTCLNVSSSSSECSNWLFSPYTMHFLVVVTLAHRMYLVTQPANWSILHPDEVFQSVEVAHSEVYGYGFRPYEYLPFSSTPKTASEKRHMELGMHSMRSWLHPRFYMIVFYVKELLGIEMSPYLFSKIAHAVVASMLPLAAYHFLRSIDFQKEISTLSAILIAFSQRLIQLGTHTIIQSLLSPVLFYLLGEFFQITRHHQDFKTSRLLCITCCFGLLMYVRPDCCLIIALLTLVFRGSILCRDLLLVGRCMTGFSTGVLIGTLDDFTAYGLGFLSPVQWIKFQVFYSGNVFGKQGIFFYAKDMFISCYFSMFLAFSIVTLILYTLTPYSERYHEVLKATAKIIILTIIMLLIYSLQSHKEIRFVHDIIVLFLCLSSVAIYLLYSFLHNSIVDSQSSIINILLYIEIGLYITNGFTQNQPSLESGYVNSCLQYVGKQNDLTGLLLDYSIHYTGGYTVLHKDVPIFAKTHYEFREWSITSRQNYSSRTLFGFKRNISLCFIDKVTNFISIENSPLVLKSVLDSPYYNYAIITNGREFLKKGFRIIYSLGNVTVYKRENSRYAKQYLENVANRLSVGSNSTLLQYEASWLMTLDLPNLAIVRLRRALQVDPKCVRCWQLLYVTMHKTDPQKAKKIAEQCYHVVGKKSCDTPTKQVVLYPEYKFVITMTHQRM